MMVRLADDSEHERLSKVFIDVMKVFQAHNLTIGEGSSIGLAIIDFATRITYELTTEQLDEVSSRLAKKISETIEIYLEEVGK